MVKFAQMPKYETYKDSGVKWLGEVPKEWEVKRLKNVATLNPASRFSTKELKNMACFLPMEKVGVDGKVDFSIQKPIKDLISGFTSFNKNDVILAKITPCFENGKGALLNEMPTDRGFGSTEFHVLRAIYNNVPKYLYYLTKTDLFMKLGESLMTGSAGQKRVQSSFVTGFQFACPCSVKQSLIANFLDQKTAQIDAAIAIKEQQIELLKERKQIIIQQAVTQGLDPNVPMKDSGVEWIGQIPEHWEVKRAKYLFNEIDERSKTGDEELLSVSHMTGVTPRSEKSVTMIAEDYTGSKTCQKNDFIMNIMWAWMGAMGVSDRPGIVSSAYSIFRQTPLGIFNPTYLEWLLTTVGYIEHYNQVSTGLHSSRLRFYSRMFFDMEIGFPDRNEQDEIVKVVKIQSTKIEQAVQLYVQQIEKLKEYKTTLINNAVTGKIKVS